MMMTCTVLSQLTDPCGFVNHSLLTYYVNPEVRTKGSIIDTLNSFHIFLQTDHAPFSFVEESSNNHGYRAIGCGVHPTQFLILHFVLPFFSHAFSPAFFIPLSDILSQMCLLDELFNFLQKDRTVLRVMMHCPMVNTPLIFVWP